MRQFFLAALTSLVASAAAASSISFDGNWKHQKFSLFSGNSYAPKGAALDVTSDGSVSLYYRAVPDALWASSGASWSWEVSHSVPATDLTRKGGDDRNLAMYFVFLPQAEGQHL